MIFKSLGFCLMLGCSVVLTACGFHLPNQTKLNETMPELVVTGDYHHPFYKMVVNRLKANGVSVIAQSSDFNPDPKDYSSIPTLLIPTPQWLDQVVSVNSRAQSIENALVVTVAATLMIPNHRPILMRNSITRSALNKPGQALASDTEKSMVQTETQMQLADELVLRLSYLGRSSDPDEQTPLPADLLYIPSEQDSIASYSANAAANYYSGLSLMEALQAEDLNDNSMGQQVSYDELNNGQAILNPHNSYKLPKVKPQPLHQAPKHLY